MLSPSNPDHQRIVDQFIQREVIYCVSTLVHDLINMPDADSSEYYDDLLSVCVSDDWETPAYDEGWRWSPCTDSFMRIADPSQSQGDGIEEFVTADASEDWRELCEDQGIEPYHREALEHWIVSSYLADLLEERDEMVSRNIHGLTVWGRTTSGQAISMDGVIWEILNAIPDHWTHREAA